MTTKNVTRELDDDAASTPQTIGQCTACGKVYPIREFDGGRRHPIGTDGTCTCGNDTFDVPL